MFVPIKMSSNNPFSLKAAITVDGTEALYQDVTLNDGEEISPPLLFALALDCRFQPSFNSTFCD
jgi:hypothetical protein